MDHSARKQGRERRCMQASVRPTECLPQSSTTNIARGGGGRGNPMIWPLPFWGIIGRGSCHQSHQLRGWGGWESLPVYVPSTAAKQTAKATAQHNQDETHTNLSPSGDRLASYLQQRRFQIWGQITQEKADGRAETKGITARRFFCSSVISSLKARVAYLGEQNWGC